MLKVHDAVFHRDFPEKRCTICGKLFLKSSKLIKHLWKHENNIINCYICSREDFDDFDMLFKHLEEHIQLHVYFCVLCFKTFAVRDNFDDHMYDHSSKKRTRLECLMCDVVFEADGGIRRLEKHWCAVHGEFRCSICNKMFDRFASFYTHCMRHKNQLPFSCFICGLGFIKKSRLNEHISTNHWNKSNYYCNICSLKFKYKPSYDAHLRSHDESLRFSCNYCGKLFLRKVSLLDHFIEKSCEICNAEFHCRMIFDLHFKRMHSLDRLFACDKCPKTYILENALKRHKTLEHLKQNKNLVRCQLCPYETLTRHNLNRHKRRNHPEIAVNQNITNTTKMKSSPKIVLKTNKIKCIPEYFSGNLHHL